MTLLVFVLAMFAFLAGILIGVSGDVHTNVVLPSEYPGNRDRKISEVLNLIQTQYVDSISLEKLNNLTIHSLVENLDPHSSYLEAIETERANESIEGVFEGIGVEFTLLRDTIFVLMPVPGGPSEKAGIKAGDRIVEVNGGPFGKGMTNDSVIARLKGPAGSSVSLKLLRGLERKPVRVSLKRGTIPLRSVETAFMLNETTGIIKLSHFSTKSVEEFRSASEELLRNGMKKLILDLRDNPGGVLNAATGLANEFLRDGQMIVYTEGKNRPRKEEYADGSGLLQDVKLLVLINENSASASEIVAGALQDHRRAKIAGRRSFGKGLVQESHPLDDGSSIRLTVARYYTPLGRSIQNPYTMGELSNTYSHPIFQDSAPDSSQVAAQGGVKPDVLIPAPDSKTQRALAEVYRTELLAAYCTDWAERNRADAQALKSMDDALRLLKIKDSMYEGFLNQINVFTEKSNLVFRSEVEREMRACLMRFYFGRDGFFRGMLYTDPEVISGIKILN